MEFGEHSVKNPIDYVVDAIKTIYNTKSDKGEIRRVNVNIAATTVENYRKLKSRRHRHLSIISRNLSSRNL